MECGCEGDDGRDGVVVCGELPDWGVPEVERGRVVAGGGKGEATGNRMEPCGFDDAEGGLCDADSVDAIEEGSAVGGP